MAFAERFGFVEVDRQVEQVRAIADERAPSGLPDGVEVVVLAEQPDLRPASYDTFETEVLADYPARRALSWRCASVPSIASHDDVGGLDDGVDVEGLFVQLDSPGGQPLLRAGWANRLRGGGLWFEPGQDERFGAVHG